MNIDDFRKVYLAMFNEKTIAEQIVSNAADELNKSQNLRAMASGTDLKVSEGFRPELISNSYKNMQFIDLKQYFANSSKVKRKKNGGWYLIIPIGVKAKTLREADWSTYKDISHDEYGQTEDFGDNLQQQNIQSAYDKIQSGESKTGLINPIHYKWKSGNVTRVHKGKRAGYISFRTVSDTSDPNSWIVMRPIANPNNNPNPPVNGSQQLDLFEIMEKSIQNAVGNLDYTKGADIN